MNAEEAPRHLVLLKEIATVVFFVIFVGICVWLLLVRRETTDAQARIPLDDGEPPADGRGAESASAHR